MSAAAGVGKGGDAVLGWFGPRGAYVLRPACWAVRAVQAGRVCVGWTGWGNRPQGRVGWCGGNGPERELGLVRRFGAKAC